MLLKKIDARFALFTGGFILLMVSSISGSLVLENSTGLVILDPFLVIANSFLRYINGAGIIIMLLFGYSSYMSKIGANDLTVKILTAPLLKLKSPYLMAVLVFFIGNLLSIVVPSASSLAVILMATLYPALRKANMSTLTAAAIIATPLGADNIIIARELGMDVLAYTYGKHALVSIPGILFMGVLHYFWQKYMDAKEVNDVDNEVDITKLQGIREELPPKIYILLPLLPIIILISTFTI